MSIFGMTTSEYLKTPKGQCNRYRWRKRTRYRYLTFSKKPPGKGTGRAEKVRFQHAINRKIKRNNWRAYRTKIAAQIFLEPAMQNPPYIHTSMKKLLDIFEKPLPESGIKRKGLIYQNDNQISYLSVRYHIGSEKNKIRAKFCPFASFLENLKFANDILSDEFNKFVDLSELEDSIEEILDSKENYFDPFDELKSLEKNREESIKSIGKNAYESMHFLNKSSAQEALLRMSALSIHELYNVLNATGMFKERLFLKGLAELMSEWVTGSSIRLKLPSLPTEENKKKEYRELIKSKMEAFHNKYQLLKPLYIPVIIQVVYKPPSGTNGFYKDLDNIIRDYILPAFHDEFKPPPNHISSLRALKENDIDDARLRDLIKEVPKSIKYSVAGYEIIEIPNEPEDNNDGFVLVAISPGTSVTKSLWDKLDGVIDAFIDSYEKW